MKLNNIFTSGAVFPAGKTIRIFGTGKGECEIEFADVKKSVKSEDDIWCAEFPAMEYGGPYTLNFTSGGERVTLNDIYIGEVYLFGGQSNIAFMLKASTLLLACSSGSVFSTSSYLPDFQEHCKCRQMMFVLVLLLLHRCLCRIP